MSSPSSLRKPAKLQPGSPSDPVRFGQYYLLGLIARGGMAEVYRARRAETGHSDARLLAIKVMRPELAKEARFVDMFHREGQLALMLRDDAIVETVELGQIDGRHFIAMEYIGGRDLTQILRRCQKSSLRIPVPHAVFIGVGIVKGLDFAHNLVGPDGRRLSLVNRDVSPSNVRISYFGEVKLLDFGIAQALMKFTSEIGILKGKFSYMSPEQIRGMPVDQRTDIFSAGIIIHEMLTTEKLFRGDTEFALMEKVRKAEVDPPSKYNRRVTPELDRIVMKALERDVSKRYQNSAEMYTDLKPVLEAYRFDVRELRDFMRKGFRREYNKDLEDSEKARISVPINERLPSFDNKIEAITAVTTGGAPIPDLALGIPQGLSFGEGTPAKGSLGQSAGADDAGVQIEISPPEAGPSEVSLGNEKSGFWSRVFKKRK